MTEALQGITVGRVAGFRGNAGEVTVLVPSGDAARWTHLRRVRLSLPGGEPTATPADVESSRAYRDRLVLKLRGIDDASAAARLRGALVAADPADVPALPDGVHWVARLIGARVVEEDGTELGRVSEVLATGGTDLLIVHGEAGRETMVPLAREIVTEIDTGAGTIRVRLPEGLRELNHDDEGREGSAP